MNVCESHFPWFLRAFSVQSSGLIYCVLADEKDVSAKGIIKKSGISPATISPTHETFAEYPARVTTTLNNFPIAEINKTIVSINKRLQLIKASKGERSKY